MASHPRDVVQSLFVTGLKNVHGIEHSALGLIDRQLDHLKSYPEVADQLRLHRAETEAQIARVEEILDRFGEQRSLIKDTWLSLTGNMAALAHVFAPDEILKNSFANVAFEHFEAASYTSLLTMAEVGGFDTATGPLGQSLAEEQRMAAWLADHNPAITRRYIELRQAGETAGH